VKESQSSAILVAAAYEQKGAELTDIITKTINPNFFAMKIAFGIRKPRIRPSRVLISSDHALESSGPALVIFTSGTTGPPKGSLQKRGFFFENSELFARPWHLAADDVILHVLPVHHATGISVTFLAPLVAGACIEFGASRVDWRFSPADMWERWRQGGLTIFSGVPTMYQRMMQYYQDDILAKRGVNEAQKYANAARAFRLLLCGTSALPFSLQQRWASVLGGRGRILERYGGTEFSGIFGAQPGDENHPDVGIPFLPILVLSLPNRNSDCL
jgi:malonyl-CoA/methylmalonyl-CoA synthetase